MSREEQGLTQGHTMVKLGQSHGVQIPIWAIFSSTKSTVRHCGRTGDTAPQGAPLVGGGETQSQIALVRCDSLWHWWPNELYLLVSDVLTPSPLEFGLVL